MTSSTTSRTTLYYSNDGTGRDTYVNYANAYWMNPLPAGTFFKSTPDVAGNDAPNGSTLVMGDGSAYPGRTLFGKSRYGTTVLAAGQPGLTQGGGADAAGSADADAAMRATGRGGSGEGDFDGHATTDLEGTNGGSANKDAAGSADADATMRTTGTGGSGDGDFDGEATALAHVPYDVSQPEQRLWQPGHSTVGLEGTNGGSTYNGVKPEWTAPRAVDNTLLRLAPTYESTCHYQLRTGRFYTDDVAPPHECTLPDKGVSWGKSRYY
ncbi:putative mitochondrial hypothetical protein [Leptomonas pyrrhocoris]|uniref:Uncharacterized protein n=1 Tax=Leptomonas pyrrhocoris TaxID=157538 RepID=A0A0N0DZK3_LEPPY|nr:putative mitochondrial hypothetical protein [Leptomonas pyrrhocoris]XP_015663831.1 putative mitochondrial hypothetical protein [Leptomonas pyrrhocoris]KPA85391.1 putative mitochondrial hypothetical protein [Leptomonas pyrrhocoris]KPA85392.1 putative mitochondrial hypothetical protein [Leptomonas pyrrhocoris]|eukprot:XP_015663830.1 putative mitochondrial hypothetical protein [Leptomonas pyrrhocoris]